MILTLIRGLWRNSAINRVAFTADIIFAANTTGGIVSVRVEALTKSSSAGSRRIPITKNDITFNFMINKDVKLTLTHNAPPKGFDMNYLQQLIQLRGMTVQDLATTINLGYHCVQKTVKGHKRGVVTRAAIAKHLDIDAARTWGRGSVLYLRRLVAIEANKVAQVKAETARTQFLKKYSDSATLTAKRKAVNV